MRNYGQKGNFFMSFLEFVKTGTLRKNLRLHILHRSFSCFFFTASCKQLREKFEGERNLKESFPALLGMVNFDQLSGEEEMFQENFRRRSRRRRRMRSRSRPCVPNQSLHRPTQRRGSILRDGPPAGFTRLAITTRARHQPPASLSPRWRGTSGYPPSGTRSPGSTGPSHAELKPNVSQFSNKTKSEAE